MTECTAPKKVSEATGVRENSWYRHKRGFSEGRNSSLIKRNGGDQRSDRPWCGVNGNSRVLGIVEVGASDWPPCHASGCGAKQRAAIRNVTSGYDRSLDIGMGKTLLKIGPIRFRTIYFIDSFCRYGELKIDNRFSNALVYAGGCLFNLITIFAINLLIIHSVLKPNVFFYQFVYFSTYYVFFALLPVRYSEKKSSDGLAIYKVLRYGERYEIDK